MKPLPKEKHLYTHEELKHKLQDNLFFARGQLNSTETSVLEDVVDSHAALLALLEKVASDYYAAGKVHFDVKTELDEAVAKAKAVTFA